MPHRRPAFSARIVVGHSAGESAAAAAAARGAMNVARRTQRHGSMSVCQRQTCSPLPSFIDDQWDDASSLLLDRPATHTRTVLRTLFHDNLGKPAPERLNQSGF